VIQTTFTYHARELRLNGKLSKRCACAKTMENATYPSTEQEQMQLRGLMTKNIGTRYARRQPRTNGLGQLAILVQSTGCVQQLFSFQV